MGSPPAGALLGAIILFQFWGP